SIAPSYIASNTGTIGTVLGAYVRVTSTAASGAATANAYGLFIDRTTVQNTTNAYGLYVTTPTGAGTTNLSAFFTTAPQFGTPLILASGGLNRTVLTSHGVLIGEGSNSVNVTAAGTSGQVLIGSTSFDPAFASISSITGTITFVLNPNNLSVDLAAPVPIAFGGTNATSFGTTTSSAIFFTGTKESSLSPGSTGQILISNGFGVAPSFQSLNGGLYWNDITGTSSGMTVNSGYLADNAGLVTLTLPATSPIGTNIVVVGFGTGGWTIAQNAGQSIRFGTMSTTVGTGGSLSSTNQYDTVYLLCTVADTTFNVIKSIGNIAFV
ncbi:MAG: hypothetical protein JSS32_06575, partial [Verrucomicrobia bacterium]|nr:hypothetical protein [Verrucomicrobiota bacterium]